MPAPDEPETAAPDTACSDTAGSASGGPASSDAPLRHAHRPRRRARVIRLIAISLAVVVVAGLGIGGYTVASLFANITTVQIPGGDPTVPIGKLAGGFNILIVGSDQCLEGQDCKDIGVRQEALNDVTILMHVSEDQQHATVVSIPRDLIVPIPSCPKEDGSGSYSAMSGQQINTTLSYGGLACTVLTVEQLSGLDIQYAGLITFQGVVAMSDAVGGVPVCLAGALDDTYTNLHLSAGTHVLEGKQALQFLRSRHGIGNGSDLTRISSQQVYLSSLLRTITSDGTLKDPTKLYKLAVAATQNMELSTGLAAPDTLVAAALTLKDIPLDQVVFVQFPTIADPANVNRVIPDPTQSTQLWTLLKNDEAFQLAKVGDGVGSEENPDATSSPPSTPTSTSTSTSTPTPVPTLGANGQTGADETCSITR